MRGLCVSATNGLGATGTQFMKVQYQQGALMIGAKNECSVSSQKIYTGTRFSILFKQSVVHGLKHSMLVLN